MPLLLNLLLIFYSLPCLASISINSNVIKYDIRYLEKSDKTCLNVLLATYSDSIGQALLKFPEGEVSLQFLFLKDSFPLEKENALYHKIKNKKEYIVKVNIFPKEKFYVNYHLCVDNPKHQPSLPVINKHFLISGLSSVLAMPVDSTNNKWEIYLRLLDMPENFNFITSFDTVNNKREFSLSKSMLDFQRAVIVGGQTLSFKELSIQGKPVQIISEDDVNAKLESYLERIITTQRTFWQDNDFPNYLIVLLNNSLEQCNTQLPNIAGRHFGNAFFIQTPHCKGTYSPHFLWLLSHELFHAWIGGKMGGREKEARSLDWFMEGFTDYYGLRLAVQSGLINYTDYINIYNELIYIYYSLPLGNISNKEISVNRNHGLYRWLARLRGHFLAKELASQLSCDHLNTLDQIIKNIYTEARKSEYSLITESILNKIFSQSLNEPLQNYVEQKIKNGEHFLFSNKALGIFSTLVRKEIKIPDFGFDLTAFFKKQVIKKLKKNSPAFKAGLREGQKVIRSNIVLPHFEKRTIIEIETIEGKKEIYFQHGMVKKMIPQYKFKSPFSSDH